jgi:2-haloacid dehalogenase
MDISRLKLISFDVFGTLISVREGSEAAFERILADAGAPTVDVRAFWEAWEERNIEGYWGPYRAIACDSLAHAFARFGVKGNPDSIQHYFDAFPRLEPFSDVGPTLERLARRYRLALASNIDDDLLAVTRLGHQFDLVCMAERARGYKPDGSLFRHLIRHAGVGLEEMLHCGQSQHTDMVGAKPLAALP